MFKFDVYEKSENCAVFVETLTFEPTDTDAVTKIRETAKDKAFWVAPADEESAYVLMQSVRRGRASNWTPEMVEAAHTMRAENGYSDTRVQMEIYKQFDTEVTVDSVKKTLRQETNVEVPLPEGLREKVTATTPAKRGRGAAKRMTPEIEAEILADFENGMNGVQVAEKHGFSNSYVNGVRRKHRGYVRNVG